MGEPKKLTVGENVTSKTSDLKQPDSSEISREEIVSEWMSNAESIANKTHDPEAMGVVSFLKEKAVVAEPIKGGYRAPSQTNDGTVFIMPLVEKDKKIDEYYRSHIESRQTIANYSNEYRILQLNESIPTSGLWKGILLLHEGMHAKVHAEKQYEPEDPKTFSEGERDAFIFEGRLMTLLGGESYKAALLKKLEELKEGIKEEGRDMRFPGSGLYDNVLDEAFGLALSEREQDTRQTAVWINAVFQLFDERYEVERGAVEKTGFIRSLYKK